MLKRRLIPKLQLSLKNSFRGPKPVLVLTQQFSNIRPIGDPVSQSKIYESQLVDELILVDLVRTEDSWPLLLDTVKEMSSALATPLAVGGGLSSFDQVQQLLDRGADKVILNSAPISSPEIIDQVSSRYGSQCVVVSIDVRSVSDSTWSVFGDSGTSPADLNPLDWAHESANRGAGEIMLTSIDHDGMCNGLVIPLISALAKNLRVPLIASGGCGLAEHFVEGYQAGAAAVAAGTFFCHRDQNPMQCRSHIRNAGLPIRVEV